MILSLFILIFADLVSSITHPTVGILAQPISSKHGNSYIPASYIKWIESAGAMAVPIPFDWPETKHREIFQNINGILFPGGGQSMKWESPYMKIQRLYYDMAMEAFDKGDYFPVWGTCLGFEALLIITSQDDTILEDGFDAWNLSLPLEFLGAKKDSKIFSEFSDEIYDIHKKKPITLNNHHSGITLSKFRNTTKLMDFYNIIAHNKDRNGKDFVSLMEGKKYPVFSTQYHPEKVSFEILPKAINHSFDSVIGNLITNLFFVNECRKSTHSFKSMEELTPYLIYNYSPVFTLKEGSEFVQDYFFPKTA